MVILVIKGREMSGALDIEFNDCEVLVEAMGKDPRCMRMVSRPILRKDLAHYSIVFRCEHGDERAGMPICYSQRLPKECSHALKLLGRGASLFFSGIGNQKKIRGSNFDPVLTLCLGE